MKLAQWKTRLDLAGAAALLAILLGLALRLRQYTLNLSFWLDEAMLALNIVQRSFAGLARPLDYDQGAPLGFLWIVKAAQVLLGEHEWSLRLFPFLAGCLGLLLLWRLARQLTGPVGTTFALLAFASSRYLVSYGAQVKQYAVDVTVGLLLQLLALRMLKKENSGRETLGLALAGAAAMWVSHAAVFALGGAGLVLFGDRLLRKDWQAAKRYGLAGLFWLANFVALYLAQYRGLAANNFLTGFWADYFMPLTLAAPVWMLDRLGGLFANPGGLSAPAGLLLLFFAAGLVSLWRRERGWTVMLLVTLGLTLAASSLGKYPFGGRMGMFLAPGLFIALGEAVELPRRLLTARPKVGLLLALALAIGLMWTPAQFALETAFSPKMTENIAPTMAYLKANAREGDVVYLYRMSIPAYRYYAPKYGLEGLRVVEGTDQHVNRQAYQAEVAQLAGAQRAWLLFSHLADYEYVDDREAILEYANELGEKRREFSLPGTLVELYLYGMR